MEKSVNWILYGNRQKIKLESEYPEDLYNHPVYVSNSSFDSERKFPVFTDKKGILLESEPFVDFGGDIRGYIVGAKKIRADKKTTIYMYWRN